MNWLKKSWACLELKCNCFGVLCYELLNGQPVVYLAGLRAPPNSLPFGIPATAIALIVDLSHYNFWMVIIFILQNFIRKRSKMRTIFCNSYFIVFFLIKRNLNDLLFCKFLCNFFLFWILGNLIKLMIRK